MVRLAALLMGIAFTAVSCHSEVGGSIRASVLDENGAPVRGAIVTFMRNPRGPNGEELTNCVTDQSGACTAWKLPYGKYSATSSNPRDAYPDMHSRFYAGDHAIVDVVHLSAKNSSQFVELRMGKKAGILNGTAVDASNGKPINATVEFHWVSNPKNAFACSCMKNAQFNLLIPSDVPVTMVVSREGYENWTYSLGRGELRNAILLHPGEELSLDIRMWPKQ
jgi:hypothetical protein